MIKTIVPHIQSFCPTHVIIAGDASDASDYRRQICKHYKRNRPPCPEPIKYQLSNAWKLCDALRLPFVTCSHYEADDVIHTFVHQAIKDNFSHIRIIADDKDLFSLLHDERVEIHRLCRSEILNVTNNGIINSSFQTKPLQMPDFLALVGDRVDNIPGCCTIGTQRATMLLNKYENIDEIYANLDEIKASMVNQLRVHEEIVYKSLSMTKLIHLGDKMDVCMDNLRFDMNSLLDNQIATDLADLHAGLDELYLTVANVENFKVN